MRANESTSAYPAHQDVDVVLRDGPTIHVRPVVPDDRVPLQRFLEGLSEQSVVFRFFAAVKDFSWAADRFVDLDYRTRHGLVALRGGTGEILAHGFYSLSRCGKAEGALEVADSMQGMGIGTLLVGQLAQAADAAGIEVFEAEVLMENHPMLQVFRDSGFLLKTRSGAGVISLAFPTSLSEDALDRFDRRGQLSGIAALGRFLRPASIAVVGASRRRGTIGGEVFHNLLDSSFPGPVYPGSPQPVVQSVRAYRSIADVPGPVDLAVVVVPAAGVAEVARACAAKGVRALLVISAGFAETGPQGQARQAELLAICREAGMRLVGPHHTSRA